MSSVAGEKQGCYFGAGPAPLPQEVKNAFVRSSLPSGTLQLSMYEMSHRHPVVMARVEKVKTQLRKVLSLPCDFELLFCAGSARHQYELIAMNYLPAYPMQVLHSGHFSGLWHKTMVGFAPESVSAVTLDEVEAGLVKSSFSAIHCVVVNETADGCLLSTLPIAEKATVFADLTSDLAMRETTFSAYDLFFAATGKALGVSGMTLVGVRRPWLERVASNLMPLQSYRHIAQTGSLYATPSLVCFDMMGHMLDWIQDQGGVAALERRKRQRSEQLYTCLSAHACYHCPVPVSRRSIHNVCFILRDGRTDDFLQQAEAQGLYGLRGHASVGGLRISLTHGVTEEAYARLYEFIDNYGRRDG